MVPVYFNRLRLYLTGRAKRIFLPAFSPFMKTKLFLLALVLCFCAGSRAQLCSGSAGDPIINISFGTHRESLPPGTTELEFTNGCPGKSQYALANLSFGCGGIPPWLMLAGDHTRDVGGNYMLVNAETADVPAQPALLHRDTARGLCGQVTYVYSAWVTSLLQSSSCGGNPVRASLYFKVTTLSGTLIDSVGTGDLPIEDERNWKQYGLRFQMPAGETGVVLSVYANRKSGCGQGFAIDDITLNTCGPPVKATVNGSAAPLSVCANFVQPFIFQGNYEPGLVNPVVQWQRSLDSGQTWHDITGASGLNYSVPKQDSGYIAYRMALAEASNITSGHCRFYSNVLSTTVYPVIAHQPPRSLLGCLGKNLLLPRSDPFANTSLWTGPNSYSSTSTRAVVPNIRQADTGLYRLQQTFSSGCSSLDSFYVNVFPSATISTLPEYGICEGKSAVLSATGDGSFFWEPATGLSDVHAANPVASPPDSTVYKVMLTNAYGCKDSAIVMVNVFRNPVAMAGPDRTIVIGDTVQLNGVVSGTAVRFSWSPFQYMNDNTVVMPQVSPPAAMLYTLTAESMLGCGKVQDEVMVKVYRDIYVPNGFSPNADGKNDVFKITAADGYRLLKFQVFNRWGQVVYEGRDLSTGWNGKWKGLPQPADTYVYYLKIGATDGRTLSKKGTVTLIR